MIKFRVALCLLVLVGVLTASAPASAQVNANGFSFSSAIITSKVLDGDRILLQVFGFHTDNSGASFISIKCPINNPINLLSTACNDLIEVGVQFPTMTGFPPDAFSDHPTHHILSSVTIGNPVTVSLSPEDFESGLQGSETWPSNAHRALRPRILGEISGIAAA